MKLKSILAFLAAAAGAFSPLPAFAADGYPRVEVGGYFETLYEVESFVAGGKERGETFNAFQTSPVHLGIFTLTTTFELNPAVDGVVEIFPLAKFKPVLTGPNEYVDIVGNGNDARSTLAGRVQATLREPFGWDGSLTVGLIRVPFGYWDDFSVERDIFQAKVNTEIFGGSPLRRLDYGASWEGNVPHLAGGKLAYRLATVSRSSPL
ncbi:MAG: hypothetical protein JWM80_1593, partial [Cyanobacteria bacterium RYN_339]|nr:hypothetical protein [Cyanobacteria bacterium RYN_339]